MGATAIGVGGMMGAGIYTLVELAVATTGVWLPLPFLVGGIVLAFSIYSTDAKAWLLWIAVILNFGLFLLLLGCTISTGSISIWITLLGAFALSFIAEAIYRNRTGRKFVLIAPKSDK